MAQSYSPQPSARWSSSSFQPPVDSETPPPPPPKPDSHEASRRGTPLTGGLAAPPSQSQISHGAIQSPRNFPSEYNPAVNQATQRYGSETPQALAEPPRLEDEWLPDIVKNKTTSELQSVLSNPALLSALSTLHPSYPASQQVLQSHLDSNKALAQHVLELESRVASLRATTESLLLNHQSLEVSWRKKQTEMDAALEPWSPKALYQRLTAAVAEQEAICHAVEESFLESDHHMSRASDKEVTDWVRRIRTEGAKLESRKEARARWDEGRVGGWR
ncbi:hypothetical protein TSTA_074010 [Talaromyces stipitatus ATCC 10500]|uniref:VPS37 C-terminal domain-containing protein n=1 Tax=Talaromyces stipitatus (strain ATCC 10500 / CBS 375.48 / QM 6759 / NRRL 1006) TaxID=441959 RepID=B8LVJ7_TALSN|nr:uncharacterized protein TSTA_074010 [Talaromyces stipitatus ATCC 10500]EED24016.1 hypothetical protein TSTA_074010 [Talaromyces stipitatus ATCC 10500]